MNTVVALFDRLDEAKRAVRDLIAHDIEKDRISLVAPAEHVRTRSSNLPLDDGPEASPAEPSRPAAETTAAVGLGSVVLGVAFLTVPAVGPVLAAGPLLAGIAAGGAGEPDTDDLPERLVQAGVPPIDAERYARAVRQGGALVVLSAAEDELDGVASILARHEPVDPITRRPPTMDERSAGMTPAG
jgi:hypothetical protein